MIGHRAYWLNWNVALSQSFFWSCPAEVKCLRIGRRWVSCPQIWFPMISYMIIVNNSDRYAPNAQEMYLSHPPTCHSSQGRRHLTCDWARSKMWWAAGMTHIWKTPVWHGERNNSWPRSIHADWGDFPTWDSLGCVLLREEFSSVYDAMCGQTTA